MYEAITEVVFEAAHTVPGHPKCGHLHGHTFKIVACLRSKTLREDFDFVRDFGEIKTAIENLGLDHRYLNEHILFNSDDVPDTPTSENMARLIFTTLRHGFPELAWVEVWEGLKNRARYYEA